MLALVSFSGSAQAYPYGGCGWGGYRGGWGGGWGYGGWGGCYGGGWGGYYWPALAATAVNAAANVAIANAYARPVVYTAPYVAPYAPIIPAYRPVVREVERAPSDPTLAKAQSKLAGLGYYKGSADGIWGDRTKVAIFEFQSGNGLPVTGKLDLKTQSALGIGNGG